MSSEKKKIIIIITTPIIIIMIESTHPLWFQCIFNCILYINGRYHWIMCLRRARWTFLCALCAHVFLVPAVFFSSSTRIDCIYLNLPIFIFFCSTYSYLYVLTFSYLLKHTNTYMICLFRSFAMCQSLSVFVCSG